MFSVQVTVEHGTEVKQRLADLARAAEVFQDKVSVGTDLLYGKFVEEGTRPHDIYPRSKQALFWAGARHPATHVHHPGTRANPFLEQALSSTSGSITAYVADQLDSVASGAGSNYSQILTGAGNLLLEAARQDAPVRTGTLRRSLYLTSGQ